ncbi:molybdopterin molybdotransferase MoeA [Chitinophagaceae bacterium MMS25-I14]
MIAVSEAKNMIRQHAASLMPMQLPLMQAAGLVLAEDIYSTADIPGYEQSSMDGYALRFSERDMPLKISGEMAAGAAERLVLQKGTAMRIFTGAPLPENADTVVMQEKVRVEDGLLYVEDPQLKKGLNVRAKGAEVHAGALAMQQGTHLTPAAVGFLAGIGITEVIVYPVPRVCVILTGNELQEPGKPLAFGQVYESNSYSLCAALSVAGVREVDLIKSSDDLPVLQRVLQQALESSDVVLLTGGVSVGDYDFVPKAAELCGVQQRFHKVKQRPGKPLYFGTKDNKLVFGLPGNPSSVLSCFYHYVLLALEFMAKLPHSLHAKSAVLGAGYKKNAGLTHFLKGHFEQDTVLPLSAQESFRLSSFAQANCLICLDEEREDYAEGETVTIYLLPV